MIHGKIWNSVRTLFLGLTCICGWIGPATAQTGPFGSGWVLEPDASSFNFQSVKNQTKVESSSFATFSGSIDPSGVATIRFLLDSVDTKVDLRNVRMRFLMFETFQYPEAVVSAVIDPGALADLAQVRRKTISLPYTLTLHGVTKAFEASVVVTQLADDMVAVSTGAPIVVATEDFNLTPGVKKLEEAANVVIIPSATVTFDFVFRKSADGVVPTAPAAPENPSSVALETAGNFDLAACKGRFEILSRSGHIYFRTASAMLDSKSAPLLDSMVDIIERCPGLLIEISGHTDSDGSNATNQRLSDARAASVARYFQAKGIDKSRFVTIGYGETRPVAPNDTSENKARNRRIEFAVVGG
ncbi:MAG: OmpA family protein [Rhodobacteraceae bacterium]|nr:OmpA family protein [Paracoccaceae bacterium]MCP5342851.1 OmpA family protein [Paracoccaceae bacterium]